MSILLSKATQRLTRELQEVKANPTKGMSITPTDNLFVWTVVIDGPPESPYAGGKFTFTLTFSGAYPQLPPKVKCNTKIYHCNINMNGDVCLNIIKEDWSPLMTASGIAVGLQQLLSEPNPDSPLNPETGMLFASDNEKYIRKARLYTRKFAM